MSSPASATTRALSVPELVLEITAHLDGSDLARVARLSKEWQIQIQNVLYDEPDVLRDYHGQGPGWDEVVERMGLLSRTLEGRKDLATRVAKLTLLSEGNIRIPMSGLATFDSGAKVGTTLLALCPKLTALAINGKLVGPAQLCWKSPC